ncbi:DEAD/DEAH box helicase [Rhodoferax mekongensis]|uniref:DEAD/DEAH box helicase n=1 Tax=Rhodoferax mekongensis TaxID=3068341 RepID=UPI0028BD827D|nr:DEAD/DEAH box helicase family protein [Rhodoferax sp. TBRC 17199]MDT7516052.1 DEAD/DEAH box helicase family protein [Rhodoferax sp. TBRC 17199]
MLELKNYQQGVLTALNNFLLATRTKTVPEAFAATISAQGRIDPYHALFGDVPSVCLRVPTGGGKTLLAAHSVALAGKRVLDTDSPVALWLTPSDAIRTQTLEALANARHPYRMALTQYFGDRVRVCDLDSLQTISPHDVGKSCIIVVATIQAFNVSDTAKRNVYSFFEELAPHFDGLPPNATEGLEKVKSEDLANQPYLTAADVGRVKYSLANWLHLRSPVVIVDEAHNNRTQRFFETLGRFNPSCIIELTATPVVGNNVLHHVSAQELKSEDMIKLPIVLAEHPDGWQACLRDSILTRKSLLIEAQKEQEYIRPIVLIQAMPKGGEATVDVVKKHLMEQENVPEEEIKIATGSQKELDGIDLFDRSCKVNYVITVEALKEGWDCSFAYVLASLQSVNSAKDVEQLLGRVLRMPYAKARKQEALNKAYAHIVAENFAQAASTLKDKMVQNMGFERLDTASLVVPQVPLNLLGGSGTAPKSAPMPDCVIELPQVPDTQNWTPEVKQAVQIKETSQGATLVIKGDLPAEELSQVEAFIANTVPAKARESVKQQFDAHRAVRQAIRAPAQLGVSFASIPQLCLNLDGHLEVVERETLADLGGWSLLDKPVQLQGFAIQETVNSFEIDVNGERVKYRMLAAEQLGLNDVGSQTTEQGLVRWLDIELRRPYLSQLDLQAYLVKMVAHLIHERSIGLTALVRAKYQLAQALDKEIERLRQLAIGQGFQAKLFEMTVPTGEDLAHYGFRFEPGRYPARQCYQGSYEFQKHFYPQIHDLREKTPAGKTTEEFRCAQVLDAHPKVKHWVRNIEQQPKFSFWLPTATDYFYPDFVAELTDGRVLVIEYKGEPYKTNDDSREKRQVGEQWEKASGGRCLFLFAVETDDLGRSVAQQIAQKVG